MALQNTASFFMRLCLVGAFMGTPVHGMESKKDFVSLISGPLITAAVVGAVLGFVAYKLYQYKDLLILSGSARDTHHVKNQKSFVAWLYGSSQLTVSGVVSAQKVCASGSSKYHAYQLQSETAHLNLTGSSEVYLTVTKEITGCVEGSCKVHVWGNPINKLKLSGSAEYDLVTRYDTLKKS